MDNPTAIKGINYYDETERQAIYAPTLWDSSDAVSESPRPYVFFGNKLGKITQLTARLFDEQFLGYQGSGGGPEFNIEQVTRTVRLVLFDYFHGLSYTFNSLPVNTTAYQYAQPSMVLLPISKPINTITLHYTTSTYIDSDAYIDEDILSITIHTMHDDIVFHDNANTLPTIYKDEPEKTLETTASIAPGALLAVTFQITTSRTASRDYETPPIYYVYNVWATSTVCASSATECTTTTTSILDVDTHLYTGNSSPVQQLYQLSRSLNRTVIPLVRAQKPFKYVHLSQFENEDDGIH